MVSATPTDVGEVLRQLLDDAISQAGNQPQQLSDWFDEVAQDVGQLADQVRQVPENLARKLEEPPFRPPDWWSLLVFTMLRIRDLLGDDRLSVGCRHPAGWSRMLTLTYSEDPADPDNAAATLGIAITDPGVKHGIWLQIVDDLDVVLGGDALRVTLAATGQADWEYTFGAPMTGPAQQARATVTLQWSPWSPGTPAPSGAFAFELGPLQLNVEFRAPEDPLYRVTVGLGSDGGRTGIGVRLDAQQALGEALSSFVDVAPLQAGYSPSLVLAKGASPQFTLGNPG